MPQCRICNNDKINKKIKLHGTMYGTRGEFDYFICSSCGCLQIKECPEDIAKYYDSDQYYSFNMNKRSLRNELLFLQLKNQIKGFNILGWFVGYIYPVYYKYLKYVNYDEAILDVGCGDGEFLRWLGRLGFSNVMGIDPFVSNDIELDGKLLVASGDVRDYSFQQKYKMITLIHSIEHVYEQKEEIEALDRILEDDGYIVMQTPLFSEYYWNRYGDNLYTLDPPRHFYLHTKNSMVKLMQDCNYELVELDTEIDVAIPGMARNLRNDKVEMNTGTGFVSGSVASIMSRGLRKKLKKCDDGAIATFVFKKGKVK